jgi:hypothetical protein
MPKNDQILRIVVNDFIAEIKQKLTEQTSADRNGKYLLQGHVTCRGLWDNLPAPTVTSPSTPRPAGW